MPKTSIIKFNINNFVKVKLTDKGWQRLATYYQELYKNVRPKGSKTFIEMPTVEKLQQAKDALGYTQFQLWEIMEIFGGDSVHTHYFETNILLLKSHDGK